MKACAKRAKAKFTWAFTASAAKVQAHEVGLKMTEESLLTKNSPSKLGGVPQGRGSVRNFIEYSQQSTDNRTQMKTIGLDGLGFSFLFLSKTIGAWTFPLSPFSFQFQLLFLR